MLKSKSLHYFLSKLFHVFISVCLIFFNIFTARAETFFSLLSEKKVLLSTDRCEEVVIFRDTGAIVELSSSHCLRNERRISNFPGAFYLLKYFSKIVFLSMVRFFLVTISDFRAHPISSAGPSSSNDICIYIYIYIYTHTFIHSFRNGTTAMLQLCCVISWSYSFSFSRAYLVLSQSRCFSKEEKCWKDLMHILFHRFHRHCLSLAEASATPVGFFCAWSSFDGLKRNVRNRIIGILV